MKVVFDPEFDGGYVDFTELQDGHHTERPFDVDEHGNVVGMDLDNLSQGVDLTDPRLPKQYLPELARCLRRKGYKVILEKREPAFT
ncbi:MAG TPA: hypothetical protein VIR57_22640 [Chloroflexota bacterium]|jgi:uncharacterized protein YuzE